MFLSAKDAGRLSPPASGSTLSSSFTFLKGCLDAVPAYLLVADKGGRIIYLNAFAYTWLSRHHEFFFKKYGFAEEGILGTSLIDMALYPDRLEKILASKDFPASRVFRLAEDPVPCWVNQVKNSVGKEIGYLISWPLDEGHGQQ